MYIKIVAFNKPINELQQTGFHMSKLNTQIVFVTIWVIKTSTTE